MVLGHQVTGAFSLAPRPEGSLAEQLLHAEAMNLQLGAGMALGHRFMPGLQGLQRGLDLALPHSPPGGTGSFFSLQERGGARLAPATVGPRRAFEPPHILAMGILDWGKERLRRWLGGDSDETEATSSSPQPASPRPASPQTGPYRGTLPADPLMPYLDFFRNQGAYDWQLAALERRFRKSLSRRNSRRLAVIQALSLPETLERIRNAVDQTGIGEPRIKALLLTGVIQRMVSDYFSPSDLHEELEAALSSLQPTPEISNFPLPARNIARAYLEIGRFFHWLPLGDSPASRHVLDLYQGLLIYDGLVKDTSPEYYWRLAESIGKGEASFRHGFNTPLGIFGIWLDSKNTTPTPFPKELFLSDIAQSVGFLLGDENPNHRRFVLERYATFVAGLSRPLGRDYSYMVEALSPLLGRQDPESAGLLMKIHSDLERWR